MTWIHRLKSSVLRSIAISLREKVRRHLADALYPLDDRSLANIGVSRCRIPEQTREIAEKIVRVPANADSSPKEPGGAAEVLAR